MIPLPSLRGCARGVVCRTLPLVALVAACSSQPADGTRDAGATDAQPDVDTTSEVSSPDGAATDGPAADVTTVDATEDGSSPPDVVAPADAVGDVSVVLDGAADAMGGADVADAAEVGVDAPSDVTRDAAPDLIVDAAVDTPSDRTVSPDATPAPDAGSDATIDTRPPDVTPADVPTTDATAPDVTTPDVAPTDVAPTDGTSTCTGDQRLCGSVCVNTSTDANNCGACGARCATGRVCFSSICQVPFACTSIDGRAYGPIAAMAADITGDGSRTLASIMAVFPNASMLRTPGLSLAVREADGTIRTAVYGDAYNTAFDAAAPPLSPSTLFQAGSISKPVSVAAYLLTETADTTRTMDIRATVASLVSPPYAITPMDLLSHTAGTSVHGFGGYAPGLPLPTIDQIVRGMSPANSPAVTFGTPGPWLYSGGGYILWEAWLERVTRRDLPTLVRERLFVPAGATRSTYQQPLPASEHDAACGLDAINLPGRCRNVMPEYAAAGLWTTPTELTCIAGYLTGRRTDVLSRVQTRAVPIAGYPQRQGLGFRHRAANGVDETAGHFYEHSGTNYGYCSSLVFFSDGRAIAVMDNSCAGVSAVVVRALCRRLGWTCSGANFAAM